jgi:hypothetical protein
MFVKSHGRNNTNHIRDAHAKHNLVVRVQLINTKRNRQSDVFYTDKISSVAVPLTPIRSGEAWLSNLYKITVYNF